MHYTFKCLFVYETFWFSGFKFFSYLKHLWMVKVKWCQVAKMGSIWGVEQLSVLDTVPLSSAQVPHSFGLGPLSQHTWVYFRWTVTCVLVTGPDEPSLTELLWLLVTFFKIREVESWLRPYATSTMLSLSVSQLDPWFSGQVVGRGLHSCCC